MAYRECPNHGWIETQDYTPREGDGELVCKQCGEPVTGYRTGAFDVIRGP